MWVNKIEHQVWLERYWLSSSNRWDSEPGEGPQNRKPGLSRSSTRKASCQAQAEFLLSDHGSSQTHASLPVLTMPNRMLVVHYNLGKRRFIVPEEGLTAAMGLGGRPPPAVLSWHATEAQTVVQNGQSGPVAEQGGESV